MPPHTSPPLRAPPPPVRNRPLGTGPALLPHHLRHGVPMTNPEALDRLPLAGPLRPRTLPCTRSRLLRWVAAGSLMLAPFQHVVAQTLEEARTPSQRFTLEHVLIC